MYQPLLLASLVLNVSLLGVLGCASPQNQQQHAGPTTDSLYMLRKDLSISIPKSYSINEGRGDDSDFVQIINEDGSIVLGYETSPGEALESDLSIISIEEQFPNAEIVVAKSSRAEQGSYASYEIIHFYKIIGDNFRNGAGVVFLRIDNSYKRLAETSFGQTKKNELDHLLSSLKLTL